MVERGATPVCIWISTVHTHTLSNIYNVPSSLHAPHPRHTLAHKALCSPHPASTQVQGMGYTVAREEAPLQPAVPVGTTPSRSLQHA